MFSQRASEDPDDRIPRRARPGWGDNINIPGITPTSYSQGSWSSEEDIDYAEVARHPAVNQLLVSVDHPDFDPFIHDPLLFDRDVNARRVAAIRRRERRERQEREFADAANYRDSISNHGGSTHSQSETVVSTGESAATITNDPQNYGYQEAAFAAYPRAGFFSHDTPGWLSHELVDSAEDARQLELALLRARYQQENEGAGFTRQGSQRQNPAVSPLDDFEPFSAFLSPSTQPSRYRRDHPSSGYDPNINYDSPPPASSHFHYLNAASGRDSNSDRPQRDQPFVSEIHTPYNRVPQRHDFASGDPSNDNLGQYWAGESSRYVFDRRIGELARLTASLAPHDPFSLPPLYIPTENLVLPVHNTSPQSFPEGQPHQPNPTRVSTRAVEELYRSLYPASPSEQSPSNQFRRPSAVAEPSPSGNQDIPERPSSSEIDSISNSGEIASQPLSESLRSDPGQSQASPSAGEQFFPTYIRLNERVFVARMIDRASTVEKDINRLLESRDAGDGALERELEEKTLSLRDAVEQMVFEDPQFCYNKSIPSRCWSTHHKVISRYSKVVVALKNDGKKPVELRKAYHSFGKFVKLAMKYYRAHIQRLISHYGVTQLKFVAQEFKFEIDPSDQRREFSSEIKNLIIFFSYEALIHLGDLSRYRENFGEPNPRKPNVKNWGPAKGYYVLARKVLPTHPRAFNQLAVLAQYEHNNFTGIFYLYRSLLAEDEDSSAHEITLANLKVCFHKVLKDHAATENGGAEDITNMFSRYHALCFLNADASEYESLKSDLLNQITLAVKEKAVPATTLSRMILINIAAEHLALSRDRATMSSLKVVTFLRFNIETFTSLLIVLQQELDGASQDAPSSANVRETSGSELVSAVMRRMLPSLRLYSAWLLISHNILVNETSDMSLNVQIKQLWQTYATTLSLLLPAFPKASLKPSQYILEEDDDIAGFKPLMDISDSRRLGKDTAKEQQRDHPNEESLARILYLIEDGIELCTEEAVPIEIKNNTFAFQDGIISTDSNTGNAEYPTITLRDIPVNPSGVRATSTASRLGQANPMGSVISEPVSTTLTNKMNAMVDDLVGSSHSREDSESDDYDEVVLWKGRKSLYQPMASTAKPGQPSQTVNTGTVTSKTPMIAQALSGASSQQFSGDALQMLSHSSAKAVPASSNYASPYVEAGLDDQREVQGYAGNHPSDNAADRFLNARDIVNMVESYTSRMSISQSMNVNATNPQSSNSMGSIAQSDPVTPKLSTATIERSHAVSDNSPIDHVSQTIPQGVTPHYQPQYIPQQQPLQSIFSAPSARTPAYRNTQYIPQNPSYQSRDRLIGRNGTPIQLPGDHHQGQPANLLPQSSRTQPRTQQEYQQPRRGFYNA